jgi:hypothetical protein
MRILGARAACIDNDRNSHAHAGGFVHLTLCVGLQGSGSERYRRESTALSCCDVNEAP